MPSEPRCQPSTAKSRNAEYEEYLRNLRNWETSIKMKDAQLRSLKSKLQPATEPMPVKRPASENENAPCAENEVSRGSESTVALETLINDESTSETSGSEDEQFQAEWKRQRALIEKEKGNRLFKDGRYDEAIESYGIGIECDPQNPVLYANRAMAFLRKNMLGAAEEDCNRALEWDPNYVKAYHRRGLARQGLSKKALAAEDFRTVLSIEPNNKEARQHLNKLEKELSSGSGDSVVTKSPSLAHSSNAKEPAAQAKKPAKKSTTAEKTSLAIRAVTAVKVEPLSAPINRRAVEKPLKRVPIRDVPGGTPLKEEWVARKKTHEPELPPPATTSYQFQVDWRQLAPFPELRYRYLKFRYIVHLRTAVMNQEENAVMTVYIVNIIYKVFCTSNQMNPNKLGTFFQESMETELFCDILCILENQFIRDGVDIYPMLSSLPKVGRFSTLVMFLGSEDKKRLARLLVIASKVDPGLADSYGL